MAESRNHRRGHRHLGAAHQRGQERQARAGEPEGLPSLEHHADDPEHEGHSEGNLDRGADDRHRVDVAQRGGGEDRREPEAEHRAEGERAQHRRDHTGDPAQHSDPARHCLLDPSAPARRSPNRPKPAQVAGAGGRMHGAMTTLLVKRD